MILLDICNSTGLSALPQYFCNDQNYGSLQGMEDAEQSAGKAQCVCTDRAENNQRWRWWNWQIHLCCQGAGHSPFPELGSWHASREAFKDWFRILTSITSVTELQGSSCLRNIPMRGAYYLIRMPFSAMRQEFISLWYINLKKVTSNKFYESGLTMLSSLFLYYLFNCLIA